MPTALFQLPLRTPTQVALCQHRVRHRRHENQIPIALATQPAPNFPRLRALALFRRRPPECEAPLSLPASENLHNKRRCFRICCCFFRLAARVAHLTAFEPVRSDWFVAVGAPMALVRTRPRIKHDRAPIAVTISNKHLGFGTWKAPASPSGSSRGRPDMLAPSPPVTPPLGTSIGRRSSAPRRPR
jgi:hypothetical protein